MGRVYVLSAGGVRGGQKAGEGVRGGQVEPGPLGLNQIKLGPVRSRDALGGYILTITAFAREGSTEGKFVVASSSSLGSLSIGGGRGEGGGGPGLGAGG